MNPWIFQDSWQGLVPYEQGLTLQNELADKIRAGLVSDQILGLEHPHVITLGKRSKLDPEIPEGPIQWVERGGEATLHSEGQLVIYPLVKLKPRYQLREWVDFLHLVSERAFERIGISTFRRDQSGLWTEAGKIAFMGLRIKEGVSLHGLSFNVSNDLGLFTSLKACGVRGAAMDSLRQRGVLMPTREFFGVWMQEFRGLSSCPVTKS